MKWMAETDREGHWSGKAMDRNGRMGRVREKGKAG